jgi:hypothetical protein
MAGLRRRVRVSVAAVLMVSATPGPDAPGSRTSPTETLRVLGARLFFCVAASGRRADRSRSSRYTWGSLSLYTTSANEAKRCCRRSLSCCSRKPPESNKSVIVKHTASPPQSPFSDSLSARLYPFTTICVTIDRQCTTMFSSPERMAMLSLPIAFTSAIGVFAPVCSRPVWQHVKVLMTGAVLAPGQRTVTMILQMMGRSAAPDFQTYHRVLNRAVWSPHSESAAA